MLLPPDLTGLSPRQRRRVLYRWQTCANKLLYDVLRDAERAAARHFGCARCNTGRYVFRAYPCPVEGCNGFHVGHRKVHPETT